jgi:protein TonB
MCRGRTCIKLSHAFFDVRFFIRAVSNRASDSVPFAARGGLLALVACLHVVGVAALSRLPGTPQHDEAPLILRANWIEGASPVPSLLPQSPSMQAAEPSPIVRPAPPPPRSGQAPRHPPQQRNPVPLQYNPVTAQSALAPATADTALVAPAALDDLMPGQGSDVSAAVAAVPDGAVAGEREGDRSYAPPDFNVAYFSNPKPEYPFCGQRRCKPGLVRLRVHVTEEGRAGEVELYRSSGIDQLDKAALKAVKRWRFRPAQRAGKPVASWVHVPVRFELQD